MMNYPIGTLLKYYPTDISGCWLIRVISDNKVLICIKHPIWITSDYTHYVREGIPI